MIEYIFTLANQEEHRFTVDLERAPGSRSVAQPAFWTELAFQQWQVAFHAGEKAAQGVIRLEFQALRKVAKSQRGW